GRWGRTPAAIFSESAVGLADGLRANFAALANSRLDYYRVIKSTEAGVGLKEIGGNFEAFVADKRLGGLLKVGEIVLARILKWNGEHRFSGVMSRIRENAAPDLVSRVENAKSEVSPAVWRDVMRNVPSRLPAAMRRMTEAESDRKIHEYAEGKSEDELLAEALGEHRARKMARARQLVTEVINMNPRSSRARQLSGVLLLENGELLEAERVLLELVSEEPDNVSYRVNLASVHTIARKHEEALQQYQRCLLLNPDAHVLPAILNGIGYNAMLAGDRKQGMAAFKKARETSKGNYDGLALIAANLLQFEEYPEANKAVTEMIKLRPDSADAHFSSGDISYRLGEFGAAVKSYKKALELNPKLIEIHMRIGDALLREGRNEDAVAAYRAYLAAFPGDASAMNNMSIALSRMGRIPEAKAELDRALTISPDYASAMLNLAKLCIMSGDLDRAGELLLRAKKYRPDDPMVEEMTYLLDEERRKGRREGKKGEGPT
ncbi:MAG: tetratricopeptide repeat protein, partial [Candidatus Brocadiia bacterium]